MTSPNSREVSTQACANYALEPELNPFFRMNGTPASENVTSGTKKNPGRIEAYFEKCRWFKPSCAVYTSGFLRTEKK
jgi:hypothetical protein